MIEHRRSHFQIKYILAILILQNFSLLKTRVGGGFPGGVVLMLQCSHRHSLVPSPLRESTRKKTKTETKTRKMLPVQICQSEVTTFALHLYDN